MSVPCPKPHPSAGQELDVRALFCAGAFFTVLAVLFAEAFFVRDAFFWA
jgi:hypothetical protein